jgi:hypothetical protein
MAASIRAEAVRIFLAEERARGWKPTEIGVPAEEKRRGCDVLSIPPEGWDPYPVEVKGWGEPSLSVSGRFNYPKDIRASQMESAKTRPQLPRGDCRQSDRLYGRNRSVRAADSRGRRSL